MTESQSRISQLERAIRRWRRTALILASVLALFVFGFGVLVTRASIMVERERQMAEQARDEAERGRDEARKARYEALIREASLEQARKQADAQHQFLEKGLGDKAK
jgi:hypothetical protein